MPLFADISESAINGVIGDKVSLQVDILRGRLHFAKGEVALLVSADDAHVAGYHRLGEVHDLFDAPSSREPAIGRKLRVRAQLPQVLFLERGNLYLFKVKEDTEAVLSDQE